MSAEIFYPQEKVKSIFVLKEFRQILGTLPLQINESWYIVVFQYEDLVMGTLRLIKAGLSEEAYNLYRNYSLHLAATYC